ncbi:MAG: DegT/DnrJ/EryC1/StrS family aminotransferase [Defluviitaleaceae bacterium]|nr:DegT/DnrJ/EryC1/StrS family aminotransferase [Defluviitaleaceae bacterium]
MYNELEAYISCGAYPFHMPGHKRNANFFPPNLFQLDVTELPETDVLSAPGGMIRDLQEKISRFYGSDESFLLVNGSSAGVSAAVCAVTSGKQSRIFVPRNAHASAVNGLVLSGATPIWFLPEFTTDGLAGRVSPQNFDDMPYGAAALIVSPTYEGFVSDIAAIAAKVHARGGVLIVDEAHGAHFAFHDYFPAHALACGADIVVNSFHKTLPMLSGCAVLHVKGGRVDVPRLRFFINAMQTTSPSFAMMAQCDFALEKLWAEPDLFDKYVERLETARQEFGQNIVKNDDPGKLLFNGVIAADDIAFEMTTDRHTLAMTSVADTDEGFARLSRAVQNTSPPPKGDNTIAPVLPEIAMSPREAIMRNYENIPSEQAIGRISAEVIVEYPPGIACLVPGERITKKISNPTLRVVRERTSTKKIVAV